MLSSARKREIPAETQVRIGWSSASFVDQRLMQIENF
jgi:hypothetical protein